MATDNKVFIQVGSEVIELTGDELTAFEADRKASRVEVEAREAEQDAKAAARQSALAKLAALGLTQEEIEAL
jgi:hypothetical protein